MNRLVEQGVVFYLKPPATYRSPEISEWHDDQRRLVNGKVYKRRVRALDKTKLRVVSRLHFARVHGRAPLGQRDLAAAIGW